jgi:ubiquinone/menaquinone biosynthesis C-methylase UbiE
MNANAGDLFSSAKSYEGYVGRWSRPVAHEFVAWVAAPPSQTWLDVGAGTGILTEVILQDASPAKVVGIDLSEDYIAFAKQRIHDDRVELKVEDADKIAFETPEFDVSVAGLVLNFLPSPEQTMKSMVQAVRDGGIVAAYVWDYSGQMEMMRHFWDAAIQVDPTAESADAGPRFAICRPENLRALYESVGLTAVDVIPIDVPTHFENFDDYWLPFLGAQGSVSKYLRSTNDAMRTAIRDQLQKQLPIANDGRIQLVARAWAVKGIK